MNTKILSLEEVIELCTRKEDHFFDRKALGVSGKAIQKVSVAFANSDGGEFIIGIADEKEEGDPKNRWKGAKNFEHFNQFLQAIVEIKPALIFTPTFLKHPNNDEYALHLEIEKSPSVHQTSDGTVYIRVSAQSLPVKEAERIIAMTYAKGASSFEDQFVKGATPEDIVETEEINNFLKDYSPKTDPLDFALKHNFLDRKNWEPKISGILLFNQNPSNLLPLKCSIKVSRYETKEEDPEREHLKEQYTVEGPLYPLIHQTIDKISEIMTSVKIWTTAGLKTVKYPPEAVWEIVVNAIIHRDYSISDDIQILIFDNRIEVISPGRLPGYVTVENILEARFSRNSKIVKILNRYKEPPNKDMGEGLNTAFQKMKEWRLKDPFIEEIGNYVKVTIPHSPLARPEEAILEFLGIHGAIRNRQARDITGIKSENSVKNVFYRLRDERLIERVPGLDGSAAAWRLLKK